MLTRKGFSDDYAFEYCERSDMCCDSALRLFDWLLIAQPSAAIGRHRHHRYRLLSGLNTLLQLIQTFSPKLVVDNKCSACFQTIFQNPLNGKKEM